MAFNEKEQQIIQWGLQNGKSKEETKEALTRFRLTGSPSDPTKVVEQEPTIMDRVSDVVKTRGENVQEAIAGTGEFQDSDVVERGFRATSEAFGAVPEVILESAPEPVRGVVEKVGEKFANVVNYLADKIGGTELAQKFVTENPEAAEKLEEVAKIGQSSGEIAGTVLGAEGFLRGTTKLSNLSQEGVVAAKKTLEGALNETVSSLKASGSNQPPIIMNRVARLKPNDFKKFQQLSGGETVGDYLVRTGNFNAPDKIIQVESTKFLNSLRSVDDELSKLPGVYKTGPVDDALNELFKKAESVSSNNIRPPYYSRLLELSNKHKSTGLTMSEINEVKRLFERNVKLGFNKLINADKVEQATNIDNAIRRWQVEKARELGFENIREINKQTQLSRFVADKLGEQIIGQSGLNGVSLTDWIILSGGDASSIAGFITKKFLSDKSIQAKIAEILNQQEIKSVILPETSITPEYIRRQISPEGLEALPPGASSVIENRVPINLRGESTIEPPAQNIIQSTPGMQPGVQKGLLQSSSNNTTPDRVVNTNNNLLKQATEYQNPDQFINSFGKPLYHGTNNASKIEGEGFKLSRELKKESPFFGDDFVDGVYLSRDVKDFSDKGYLKSVKDVIETRLVKTPNLIKFNNTKDLLDFIEFRLGLSPDVEPNVVSRKMKNEGFDGVEIKSGDYSEIIIFDPSNLKTKSQLTDIWNKANKKEGIIRDKSRVTKYETSSLFNYNDLKSSGLYDDYESGINFWKNKIKNKEEIPPIIVDKDDNILDGLHRAVAAEEMKLDSIPSIRVTKAEEKLMEQLSFGNQSPEDFYEIINRSSKK